MTRNASHEPSQGPPRLIVVEALKTCVACPAQWECQTDDEQSVYIRYRHGTLRMHVGVDIDDAVRAPASAEIYCGGEWDGFMDWEEMTRLLAPWAEFACKENEEL